MLEWFRDYLSNRKQAVVIKGFKSEYLTVEAGVPQGSVLGPVLFPIYINDITLDISSVIKLFADDTSMYKSLNHDDTRSQLLNQDLDKISTWASKWKVLFNSLKTKLLNIKRSNTLIPNTLTFEGSILTHVDSHKHLGLIIQHNGKWDEHIDAIVTRCRSLVSCLKSYK